MKKPPKMSASALTHPKASGKSEFNGDVLRKEKTFNDRVKTVEGTRAPSGLRHLPVRSMQQGKPSSFEPALRPLTDRQKKMLS